MLETFLILLICFGWLYLSILVHAVVRSMAGWLLEFKVHQVWVGSGEWKWSTAIAGTPWHFGPFPVAGYTHLQPGQIPGLRWRGALMSLIVLAVDVAMIWTLVQFWPVIETYFPRKNEGPVSAFLTFTLFIRGVDVFIHLLPMNIIVDGLAYPTEGKLLFEYLTGSYAESWARAFQFREGYAESVARYDPGFQLGGSWLLNTSEEERELFVEEVIESAKGNHAAAIEKCLRLLENPELTGGERARFLDHMASDTVMNGYDAGLGRALEWAREAQALVPHARTVRGALGAVLVQTGSCAEAIDILTPLTTPENEHVDRTVSSIYLAKAWDRQGDHAQAAQWMMKSIELGGFEEIRNRILAELSPDTKARQLSQHGKILSHCRFP